MLPDRIPNSRIEPVSNESFCRMAEKWGVSPDLLWRLIQTAGELPFDIMIFSGARARGEQERVSGTTFDRSTHANEDPNGCPRYATGADVQPVSPGVRSVPAAVAQLGAAAVRAGLRWGGGAPVGPDGIPVGNERWHFDLGPR